MPQFFSHPLVKPETLEFRLYQARIIETCLKGNTLVVLPTGLGKTVIAMLTAAEKLKNASEGKIIVLAPSRPLVHQHYQNFRKTLTLKETDFAILTGEIPPKQRKEKFKAKIIFATPQALENDFLAGRIGFEDVVLMVFDEAHRAVGGHSYVFLAEEYVKRSRKPLILALTASPGSTKEQIEEVKRNLSIRFVEARSDRSLDVKPYVQPVAVKWIRVKLPETLRKIQKFLQEYLNDKLNILVNYGVLAEKKPNYKNLLEAENLLKRSLSSEADSQEILRLLAETSNAKRVRHALILLETQGVNAMRNYFAELKAKASRVRSLKQMFMDSRISSALNLADNFTGFEHPKLEKLPEILAGLLAEGSRRIIIFTNFRKTAKRIEELLKDVNHIRAIRLIGQTDKINDSGLTRREQVEILENFKNGVFNVLIATQVGEEGLDISASDAVVFYDNVPSAIRFVQRKGRTGRKNPGKIVIFLTEGSSDEAYYWIAVRREKTMREFIRSLQAESQIDVKQETLSTYVEREKFLEEKDLAVKVFADLREGASRVIRELIRLGVNVELKSLNVGDYIISENLAIERKKVEDLAGSMVDGRLFRQAQTLASAYSKPLIIVEGEASKAYSGVKPQALRGALLSLIFDYKIPVIWLSSPVETAQIILLLARREQLERKGYPALREKKPLTLAEMQEYVVAGLPGVELTLARRLLDAFGSVEKVFTASREELVKVKGVGEKLAEKIRHVVAARYKREEES
jgi:Fanconi anemia group M protein